MDRPIGIGVLGAGSIFLRRHLPALKNLAQDLRLVAVSRRNPERLAEAKSASGCHRGYADWRDVLIDPDVDAVLVASPNALHAPQAIAAIEAGKDVLCEKPPAASAEDARAMAQAAQRTGRILQYGFLMRFSDETQCAKRCVADGLLGYVYHVRTAWLRRRGYPTKGSWFTTRELAGGGALMDLGCHLLDRALYLLGYPKVLGASAMAHARLRDSAVAHDLPSGRKSGDTGICDVEDLAACFFRLEGNVSLILEASFAANLAEQAPRTELLGDRAGLRIEPGGAVTLFGETEGRVSDTVVGASGTGGAEVLYERQWADFVRCVRTRATPHANASEGVALMQALEAAYRSAASGREEAV